MSNPIFIARQDTLDEKIIPAQLLNDYKLHGEYSFVFHTPELWHKMCTHAYAANDQKVNGDALEYVLTKAAPTGSYSLSNWMALLCDTAEQAHKDCMQGLRRLDNWRRAAPPWQQSATVKPPWQQYQALRWR